MKKQTGIWLDLRQAWVIQLPVVPEAEIVVQHIGSDIEENAAGGGSRSKTPWGPQGGNQQHTLEERRHHQEKSYFAQILQHIDPSTEELVIFGPSEAKYGLSNLLAHSHHNMPIIGLESADHMTEHQIVAWVRKYFDRPAPRKTAAFGKIHEP